MKRIITLTLFLALLSGCAFAHSTHNPHHEYEEYYIGKAERELELLNRAIASADENDRGLLAQRKVDIEESLTNVDKNPSKLISLYGNSFAKDMLKYDPKYKDIPMPETFQSSLFEVPLVANEETAIMLVNMGIINEGTVLRLPSGEEIEVYRSRR